ncbi:ABC transporter permease [Solwaraspora sp. WMMB335]|uniref:ABC transporter permease n=1 Tax=Solwaraspora sp. WMMB335 TaxID=3404118 RepID=UPI003B932029
MLAIAGVQLRLLLRQRLSVFWLVVAPLLFVFVLGVQFGGGQAPRLAVVGGQDGPVARQLVDALATDDRFEVVRPADVDALRADVERGIVHAGLVIPAGLDSVVGDGGQVGVTYLARPKSPLAADLRVWVQAVIGEQAALVRAAQAATAEGAGTFPDNLARAATVPVAGIAVDATTVGEAPIPDGINPFALLAPSMLLLYVFLTSLTAAIRMIENRRRGITRRMYATATGIGTIVAGEALGRFGIALVQGLIVMAGSALFFGVDWGSPLGAAALLVLFCLTASGLAMLLGAGLRHENQALGIGLGLGLGLGAVGGAMVPLELLSDTSQHLARLTPHAWAYQGFTELVRHGGGIGDIAPQLGALAGFAAVLFALGARQLRRSIVR